MMNMMNNKQKICLSIFIILAVALLCVFIYSQSCVYENFTVPGVTLTIPPSWFPQNSAKAYNMNDWKVKSYLDRYPFWDPVKKQYIGYQESQDLANTNRFWIQ